MHILDRIQKCANSITRILSNWMDLMMDLLINLC